MSDLEQLMIELVNRARANPVAEAERFEIDLNEGLDEGTISPEPKQPVAPNQALIATAQGHSQYMLDYDFFGHDNLHGKTPTDRARDAGYTGSVGENIAWFGDSSSFSDLAEVYNRHEGLFRSPGHRKNMLLPAWRELGVGIRLGTFENRNAIMVTENFGNRAGDLFITGVVFSDHVDSDPSTPGTQPNGFFEAEEGIDGVKIEAVRNRDGARFTTETGATGGYTLQVPTGVYSVTASKEGTADQRTIANVVVLNQNVKLDFSPLLIQVGKIRGQVFDDTNGDGIQDPNEPALADRTVYLDADDNGELSPDETQVVTDTDGSFVFENLLPGDYSVRQVVPDGWDSTAPADEPVHRVTLTARGEQNITFGTDKRNVPPHLQSDNVNALRDIPIQFDVLANDRDEDGTIDDRSVLITVAPANGSAQVDPELGKITYTPNNGFAGIDRLRYSVADNEGSRSSETEVVVTVKDTTEYPWYNTAAPLDVSNDSFVTPVDALLVVNTINRRGARRLVLGADETNPKVYYDTSRDGVVSAIDALLVVNELNRQVSQAAARQASAAASAAEGVADQALADPSLLADLAAAQRRPRIRHAR